MNAHERDALQQELLELHFGCHENPEPLRARLQEPEVAALWQEVQAMAHTLRQAAVAPVPALPTAGQPARALAPRRSARAPLYVAAAALVVTALSAATWGVLAWRAARVRSQHVTVAVSGPTAVPDGQDALFHVRADDAGGQPARGPFRWRTFDAEGRELARGEGDLAATGATLALAGGLPGRRALEVRMDTPRGERTARLPLSPARAAPFAHLSSDKPMYRPGETIRLRAVALDRVAGTPSEGARLRLRVRDPKDATVFEQSLAVTAAEHGVCATAWAVPEQQAGGRFHAQVTSDDGSLVLADLPLLVQRFEPPRLQKEIALDRASYAPGGKGVADVQVARLGGGEVRGASVHASVLVDGAQAWQQEAQLGADGRARFAFTLPDQVARGEGRFVVRVSDGSVVESEVEPFTVPTGKVAVALYPESGDLVAGVESRVYVEVTDPLGGAVEGKGRVVDGGGREVTRVVTAHQGRGVFALTPSAGATYDLELDGAQPARFALPPVQDKGIVLRALDERVPAGAPVRVRLLGEQAEPVVVGVFCRGVLLGQTTTPLRGTADVSVALPDAASGVLRVTAFAGATGEGSLLPIAERLVQRAPKETLAIELLAEHARVRPGQRQTVRVRTRTESGAPIAAAVGLCVSDAAVRAQARMPRVGIADQAALFTDVEALEDLAPFLPGEPAQVDLLLGTRGWRRLVWRGDELVPAEKRDHVALARAQAGRNDLVQVARSASEGDGRDIAASAQAARTGRDVTAAVGVFALLVALAGVTRHACKSQPWTYRLAAGAAVVVALMSVATLLGPNVVGGLAPGARFFGWAAAPDEARLGLETDTELVEALDGEYYGFLAWSESESILADEPGTDPFVPATASRRVALVEHARREYAHTHQPTGARQDFTETVLWQPLLVTDAQGHAEVAFDVSDRVTTWTIDADAHGQGRLGQASASFVATLPFHLEAKLPVEVTDGDSLQIPVAIVTDDRDLPGVELKVETRGALVRQDASYQVADLQDGKGRLRVPVTVRGEEPAAIALLGAAGRFRDRIQQDVRVVPRGFPQQRSSAGVLDREATIALTLPAQARAPHAVVRVFSSPLATLREGLEGMLQDPHGCFEQASSTNYPNVLVLTYLEATGDVLPSVAARARGVLGKGYALLTSYECDRFGYEWFGKDPGHQALTAYGLLEFTDMAKVHGVDAGMVARTRDWLMARRDGRGGFARTAGGLHAFGSAPEVVEDAYALWALVYGGVPASELRTEFSRARERAQQTEDAYELALLACALRDGKDADAAAAARARLAGMQRPDGSLAGSTTSITGSGDDDLAVETTALAVLAWVDDPAHAAHARTALEHIQGKRSGRGTFGATQATVLALRALTAHAQGKKNTPSTGALEVFLGAERIAQVEVRGDETDAVAIDVTPFLRPGDNQVRLVRTGTGDAWPWSASLAYHADQPADDVDAAVALRTTLSAPRAREGDVVGIDVELRNVTAKGLPMTLAVVGLPASLEVPTRVLDDLRQRAVVDFYEVRGREVVLYWRGLAPNAVTTLRLDAVARVPGVTTGPASRAYLYYTPQSVRWCAPLQVEVE